MVHTRERARARAKEGRPPPGLGKESMSKHFKVMSIEEVDDIESPGWLIHELLPAKGFIQIFGREGNGKTFVALDIGLRVAAGMSWLDSRPTKKGKVVYVVGEGLSGVRKRIAAWREHHERSYEDLRNFWVVPEPVQLGEESQVNGIVASIERATGNKYADLIVFDTQARCTAGLDENSAEEMGAVVAALDWLRVETGAAVMVLHHSPYNQDRGRGSSVVAGALDTAMGIHKKGNVLTLSCGKQKDWEEFAEMQVGVIPSGESAVVIELGPESPGSLKLAEASLTGERDRILKLLREHGVSSTSEGLQLWDGSKATYYRGIAKLKQLKLLEDQGGGRFRVVTPSEPPSEPPQAPGSQPAKSGVVSRLTPLRGETETPMPAPAGETRLTLVKD